MNSQQILDEINFKYSEWLEHDIDGTVTNQILLALLVKERSTTEQLKKSLKNMERLSREGSLCRNS